MSLQDFIPVNAGQDLSVAGAQYKAITISGTIAITNTLALGILHNKPKSGEDASVLVHGRSRFKAGGAITAGNRVMVTTSGWFVAVASNQLGVGVCLTTVVSGAVADGWFNNFGAPSSVVSAHLT